MAKKEAEAKIVLERIYNIPLRKEFQKSPKWRRTKKAVKAAREFIARHMKSEDVKIGKYLNLELWKHGIKNPPHHIKVKAAKNEKGIVFVELAELPKEAILEKERAEKEVKKKEAKKEKPKIREEAKETGEQLEEKVEEAKEEKAEEAKKIEKEELKELKKEMPKIKPLKQTAMPKQVEQRPTAPKSQ